MQSIDFAGKGQSLIYSFAAVESTARDVPEGVQSSPSHCHQQADEKISLCRVACRHC